MLRTIVCMYDYFLHDIENPLLDELLPSHKKSVLEKLAPNVPLKITAPLISDDAYWERCCRGRWELCDVSEYNEQWKRMYFERNTQEELEKFVPEQSDLINVRKHHLCCFN